MTDKTHSPPEVTLSPGPTDPLETLGAQHRAHHRTHRPPPSPNVQAQAQELPAHLARLTLSRGGPQLHVQRHRLSRGQRLADGVASTIGSWRFIALQSSAIALWIAGNVWAGQSAWDPYPFILLNLLLSFQAAYTAPAIMMSQNRQSELDRRHAQSDYEINVKAELEIELLHEKIDLLKDKELLALTQAVRELTAHIQTLTKPG